MFAKTFLVLCLVAAFHVQNNDGATTPLQRISWMLGNATNTVKTQVNKGVSTLNNYTKIIVNMEQKMLNSSKSLVNSTFSNLFGLLTNTVTKPVSLFKNLTTNIISNGKNMSSFMIVSGKNFSKCLNVSQILSFRAAALKNVTTCIQTQANTTKTLLQKQISSLSSISTSGFSYATNAAKCSFRPFNFTKCMSAAASSVSTTVSRISGNVSSLLSTDMELINKMAYTMSTCGSTLSMQLVKNIATVGVNHMNCTYKLINGKLGSGSSSSGSSSNTTSSSSTSTTTPATTSTTASIAASASTSASASTAASATNTTVSGGISGGASTNGTLTFSTTP